MTTNFQRMAKNSQPRVVASGIAAANIVKTFLRVPQARRVPGGGLICQTGDRLGNKIYLGHSGEDVYWDGDKVYRIPSWGQMVLEEKVGNAVIQSKLLFGIAKWEVEFLCTLVDPAITTAAGGVRLIAFYENNKGAINKLVMTLQETWDGFDKLKACSPTLYSKLSKAGSGEKWERAKKVVFGNMGRHVEIKNQMEAIKMVADILGEALVEFAKVSGDGKGVRESVMECIKSVLWSQLKAIYTATASQAFSAYTNPNVKTPDVQTGFGGASSASGPSGPALVKKNLAEAGCMVTDTEAMNIFLELNGRQQESRQVIDSLNKNLSELVSVIESLQNAWAINT